MAYAVRRPVENVYLVRERDRRRTREFLALVLAAIPPMLVLFAAIWANFETVRLGYGVEKVRKQWEEQTERNRRLRMDLARATALSRVEEIARRDLGLVPPSPEQLVLIRDAALGGATPVPARPRPAPAPPAPVADATEEGF
jgi:cell division protein FtsL